VNLPAKREDVNKFRDLVHGHGLFLHAAAPGRRPIPADKKQIKAMDERGPDLFKADRGGREAQPEYIAS
jgi:hypothetical protein